MKVFYVFMIFFLQTLWVSGQNKIDQKTGDKFQYGIAGKLNIEYQFGRVPNFKLSIAAGVGYNIDDINLNPALHAGVILFNRGTIGSSFIDKWSKVRTHFFYSAIGTVELDKRDYGFEERYVPFYHFSDFAANPLQNPYKSSLSFGSIWIHMPNNRGQTIGIFNVNIVGRAQITYYNDGGPVLSCFGDKRDRFYTGGLLLSYHGDEVDEIDMVELSYHKFTGYVRHAFDVADKLQIDFLNYADQSQLSFNHQRWKLSVSDLSRGFSLNTALYDFNGLDLQDFLHFTTNVPFHPDYFNGYRVAIGGRYEYNYLRLTK